MIDYARMKKAYPQQKRKLTLAVKSGNSITIERVCREVVAEWEEIGCWPDGWSNWQRALNDSRPWHHHIALEDL